MNACLVHSFLRTLNDLVLFFILGKMVRTRSSQKSKNPSDCEKDIAIEMHNTQRYYVNHLLNYMNLKLVNSTLLRRNKNGGNNKMSLW